MGVLSIKSLLKLSLLAGIGMTTMANEGCKEEPLPATRKLRKLAEIGRVDAGNFQLPGGGNFDFAYVANAQLYNLLGDSEEFTLLYQDSQATGLETYSISAEDSDLFERWSGGVRYSPSDFSQEAQCLLDLPQVKVDADVLSFQVTGGGGISIGYGPGGSFDTSFIPSASVNVERAQLDVSLHGRDAISRVVLGSAQGVAHHKKFDVALTINFGAFRLGPKYYFESALSEVSRNGLSRALETLASNMKNDPWYTRLMGDFDTHIAIQAGANANLKIGDVVAVYNETHAWEGQPCRSELKGSFKEPATPVLKAKIVSLGNSIAQAQVLQESQTRYRPKIGARVEVVSMVEAGQ